MKKILLFCTLLYVSAFSQVENYIHITEVKKSFSCGEGAILICPSYEEGKVLPFGTKPGEREDWNELIKDYVSKVVKKDLKIIYPDEVKHFNNCPGEVVLVRIDKYHEIEVGGHEREGKITISILQFKNINDSAPYKTMSSSFQGDEGYGHNGPFEDALEGALEKIVIQEVGHRFIRVTWGPRAGFSFVEGMGALSINMYSGVSYNKHNWYGTVRVGVGFKADSTKTLNETKAVKTMDNIFGCGLEYGYSVVLKRNFEFTPKVTAGYWKVNSDPVAYILDSDSTYNSWSYADRKYNIVWEYFGGMGLEIRAGGESTKGVMDLTMLIGPDSKPLVTYTVGVVFGKK